MLGVRTGWPRQNCKMTMTSENNTGQLQSFRSVGCLPPSTPTNRRLLWMYGDCPVLILDSEPKLLSMPSPVLNCLAKYGIMSLKRSVVDNKLLIAAANVDLQLQTTVCLERSLKKKNLKTWSKAFKAISVFLYWTPKHRSSAPDHVCLWRITDAEVIVSALIVISGQNASNSCEPTSLQSIRYILIRFVPPRPPQPERGSNNPVCADMLSNQLRTCLL